MILNKVWMDPVPGTLGTRASLDVSVLLLYLEFISRGQSACVLTVGKTP